ncbi:MDR family MFS transporter [Aquicoccus sp. G2-2]|uniref:MDR family MFS transporter n=1 Tax=Aquicoccus sp. G2-2 TaxID=3092120 RepID=UPI002AE06946|nr:MDR family MFS transporter [Aquicoccus sp. G2-2]MEA1114459.1 MDR family MFS transporter [Aquicoccus sp. G2-2]
MRTKQERHEDPRRLILAALMCTMMLAAMDTTIVSTAIPQIVGDLGGFRLFSWVFSIYLLAQTVTIPIYGKLSDLFGRKPVLMSGMLIFLAGSAASALSWNMVSLIAFRGLQGLGAGAIMATVSTLAGDLYSVRERAAVQGWLASVWGVAAIIGPLLGGAFAEYVSWRWIFVINLPVGALALGLLGTLLHEEFERRHPHIDYVGAALVLASVGAVIFGLLQGGQAWPWLSPISLTIFSVAAVLLVLTVLVERRAPEPVMPGWLWRRRELAVSNLGAIGMGAAIMAPSAYLPTFSQSVQGLGAIAAGLVLAAMSIGWPTASALSGHLYTRIGFRDTALAGTVLIGCAATGFLLIPTPQPIWAVVMVQVVLGAGLGLVSTSLIVGVQSVVGWGQRGVVTGANMFSRYLGQSLGAALFGAIFNSVVAARLTQAPATISDALPHNINDVIATLHTTPATSQAAAYLRDTIALATHDLYLGMAAIAVLIFAILLAAPRHFPVLSHDAQ